MKRLTYQQLLNPKYVNTVNNLDFIYEDIIDEEGTFHSNSKRLKKYIEDKACLVPMPTTLSKTSLKAGTSKLKKKFNVPKPKTTQTNNPTFKQKTMNLSIVEIFCKYNAPEQRNKCFNICLQRKSTTSQESS